jgi:hypothetical protein
MAENYNIEPSEELNFWKDYEEDITEEETEN